MSDTNGIQSIINGLSKTEQKILNDILELETSLLNKESAKRIHIKKDITEIIKKEVTLDDNQ